MFPSWTWAACKRLSVFSRKSTTESLYSLFVDLEDFVMALGSSNSTTLFKPSVYLNGWVTNVQ
jgi:hypothetical protein